MPDTTRYVAFESYSLWEPNGKLPYGRIVVKGQPDYQLTKEDVLWAARSVVFEGGDPADVIWTETQRFAYMQGVYGTFAAFVQAFSQPINPDWRRSGVFCRAGGTYAKRAECAEARLVKRDQAANSTWAQLRARDPQAVETVLRWANADLRNPLPRSTNFADATVAASFLLKSPESVVLKTAGNVYIMEPVARNWATNHVTVSRFDGALATADGVVPGSKFQQTVAVFLAGLIRPV